MAPLRKWKIITAISVIITIILCMMTIYTQKEYNDIEIVYGRIEADDVVLKKDYEKLYAAYYSYEKKILKILEGNENVFWAKDSSAYVVKNENEFLFSFYKKPRLSKVYSVWIETNVTNGEVWEKYRRLKSIDSIKPHQFIVYQTKGDEKSFMVAQGGTEPYDTKIVISVNK